MTYLTDFLGPKNHKLSSLKQEKYLPEFPEATSLKGGHLGEDSSSPLAVSGVTNTPSDPQEILRCTKFAPHIPPHVSPKDVSHMQSEHALRSSYLKRSIMTPFPNRATVLAMDLGVGLPRHVFEVHKPTTMYYTHKKICVGCDQNPSDILFLSERATLLLGT